MNDLTQNNFIIRMINHEKVKYIFKKLHIQSTSLIYEDLLCSLIKVNQSINKQLNKILKIIIINNNKFNLK